MVPRKIGSLRWVMQVTRIAGFGERSPAMFRCGACGHLFPADPRTRDAIRCALCASEETTFVSGREYLVQQIEVI